MSCLTTTRSATKKSTRKKQQQQKHPNQNFTAKTRYVNLKASRNNVKLQSDKTLLHEFTFFLTKHLMMVFFKKTM